jgi:hypothetical protein
MDLGGELSARARPGKDVSRLGFLRQRRGAAGEVERETDLVGETMMAPTWPFSNSPRSAMRRASRSSTGRTKASVLPEPVTASTTTSLLRLKSGIVEAWTGVIRSRWRSSSRLWRNGWSAGESVENAGAYAGIDIARMSEEALRGGPSRERGKAARVVVVKGGDWQQNLPRERVESGRCACCLAPGLSPSRRLRQQPSTRRDSVCPTSSCCSPP